MLHDSWGLLYIIILYNGLISKGNFQRAAAKINFEGIIFKYSIVMLSAIKIIFVSAHVKLSEDGNRT